MRFFLLQSCVLQQRHMATINKCQLHARSGPAKPSRWRDQQTALGHEIKYVGELFVCLLLPRYFYYYFRLFTLIN